MLSEEANQTKFMKVSKKKHEVHKFADLDLSIKDADAIK